MSVRLEQASCAGCGRVWEVGDVATMCADGDGLWRHHDCGDPKLEVAVPAPW